MVLQLNESYLQLGQLVEFVRHHFVEGEMGRFLLLPQPPPMETRQFQKHNIRDIGVVVLLHQRENVTRILVLQINIDQRQQTEEGRVLKV